MNLKTKIGVSLGILCLFCNFFSTSVFHIFFLTIFGGLLIMLSLAENKKTAFYDSLWFFLSFECLNQIGNTHFNSFFTTLINLAAFTCFIISMIKLIPIIKNAYSKKI